MLLLDEAGGSRVLQRLLLLRRLLLLLLVMLLLLLWRWQTLLAGIGLILYSGRVSRACPMGVI